MDFITLVVEVDMDLPGNIPHPDLVKFMARLPSPIYMVVQVVVVVSGWVQGPVEVRCLSKHMEMVI